MEIIWLRRAIADLEDIEEFIAERNVVAAWDVAATIHEAIALLMDQPKIGRLGRVAKTRELIIPGTPYIVAYSVDESRIKILAIIHGARSWPGTF